MSIRISAEKAVSDYIAIKRPYDIKKLSEMERRQISYTDWAAKEVLLYIHKRQDITPLEAIEEFIVLMDEYSCVDPETSFIFSVAHDVAENIIDYISNY